MRTKTARFVVTIRTKATSAHQEYTCAAIHNSIIKNMKSCIKEIEHRCFDVKGGVVSIKSI